MEAGKFIWIRQGERFYEICQQIPFECPDAYLRDDDNQRKVGYPLGFCDSQEKADAVVAHLNAGIAQMDGLAFAQGEKPPEESGWVDGDTLRESVNDGDPG